MLEMSVEIELVNGPLDGHREILLDSQQRIEDVLSIPVVRQHNGRRSGPECNSRRPIVRNAVYRWTSTCVKAARPGHRVEKFRFQRMVRDFVEQELFDNETLTEFPLQLMVATGHQ